MLDDADTGANHARFITEVIAGGQVWGLTSEDGFLASESSSEEERAVLPFWSDEAYAKLAQTQFEEAGLDSIPLFDFLFRWLPGMADDEVLAGTNWTPNLEGREVDPLDLQDEILDAMDDDVRITYLDRLAKEVKESGGEG